MDSVDPYGFLVLYVPRPQLKVPRPLPLKVPRLYGCAEKRAMFIYAVLCDVSAFEDHVFLCHISNM